MSNEENEVHTYDAGRNEYRSRPGRVMVVISDGKQRCDRPGCTGSCNDASERVNDGAEGFLRRLRGGSE